MTATVTRWLVLVAIVLTADRGATQEASSSAVHAVSGEPLAIYYDNCVLTETPERYRFETVCPIGADGDRCWTATPTDADRGVHPLRLRVHEGDRLIAEAATTLHVAARDAGRARPLALLIVGDSLTNATLYPNELARLLSRPGNPRWRMLGTRLDVRRYLDAQGGPPDVVFFLLGINDCFGADPESREAIDGHIDRVFTQAETLLSAFHEAAPQADLAICTTPPPNARESGFEANYKGRYHRWGWKRIQHRLVQRQLAAFAGQEDRRRFLVPTNLAVDPVDGYPVDNGVHPNPHGYRQIGGAIYAWLKGHLEPPVAAKP